MTMSEDQLLFDFDLADETHEESLARVSSRIGRLIVSFCQWRIENQRRQFHMQDLVQWVRQRDEVPVAPDSASRILRDLRQKKAIDYRLLSRRHSHYEVLSVRCTLTKKD